MLQIQLYVENDQGVLEEVELYKDESVTLTQSIQDIKDIEKVFTDYSKTFNVPASKRNNKFFKHFYNYFIDGFDARRKKRAELHLNYKPFKKGKIKLEGTTLKNNEPHTYKLTFFGNTVTLKDLIGEDKLGNLTYLDAFSFDYNDTNIAEYMTSGLEGNIGGDVIDDGLIIPLITHTNRLIYDSTDTSAGTFNVFYSVDANARGVYFNQLKPAIRVYAIIKAIEKKYEIKFSNDFFNKTNLPFYNLYMWLHTKEGSVLEDQDAQYTVSGFTDVRGDVGEIDGVKDSYFKNSYDESKNKRTIRVKVTPSSNDEYTLVIKKNGEEFKKYSGLTDTTTNGSSEDVPEVEIPNGEYTFFIEATNVATFDVQITVINKPNSFLKKQRQITFDGAAGVSVNERINITSQIPKMGTLEFLTGLFKMFNLTSYVDDDGVIVVKTLDNYFASSTKTWDITDHLDKEETIVDSVIPYRQVNLGYKGGDTFLAKNHENLANKKWGTLEYAASDNFEGEAYNIELPFEHMKFERLVDIGTGDESPVQYGWSVDTKQDSTIGEPILFYATKPIATIPAVNIAGNRVNIVSPYTPSNSLVLLNLFGSQSQSLNFHSEFDEYTGIPNESTLFENYYKSYVEDLFDKRKRLTFASAYLPMTIIERLSLADKIIIFDKLYRINKITTNFETNKSDLELTNILELPKFITSPYAFDIDISSDLITADTTLFTADIGDLTADGFIYPSETTEVPATIPPNDPEQTTSEICQATPATIQVQSAISYCDKIQFAAYITDYGTFCGVDHIDEYGFFLSSNSSYLTASDDIATLKADSNIEVISVRRQAGSPSLTIGEKLATKTGLTDPATYYARFYVRTYVGDANPGADVISSLITESTDCGIYATADNTNLTVDDTDSYTADVGDTDGDGIPEAQAETAFYFRYSLIGYRPTSIPTYQDILDQNPVFDCGANVDFQTFYHNGLGAKPVVGDSIKTNPSSISGYNTYEGGSNTFAATASAGEYIVFVMAEESFTASNSTATINQFAVVDYDTAKVVAIYNCPIEVTDETEEFIGDRLSDFVSTSYYGAFVHDENWGSTNNIQVQGLQGSSIREFFNRWNETTIKSIVTWFSGESNPQEETFYSLSRKFKVIETGGADAGFQADDISSARILYGKDSRNRWKIYIEGHVVSGFDLDGSTSILALRGDIEEIQ